MSSILQSMGIKKKRSGVGKSYGNFNTDDSPLSNPIAIILIIIIAISFILYGLYKYFNNKGNSHSSHTYYGQDIRTWTPIFTMNSEHIEPCIERCKLDPACGGITMDRDSLTCTGSRPGGKLRQDTDRYSAWVKPAHNGGTYGAGSKEISRYRVMGLVDSAMRLDADKQLVGLSSSGGFYNISMMILQSDFYEGHGKWRHIMHLGTDPQISGLVNKSSAEWTIVSSALPDQLPGLWIGPYNNNMRVSMTTIQKPDPNADKSKSTVAVKRVEWVDVGNALTPGKPTHISINVYPQMVEVFLDGNLNKSMMLRGRPLIPVRQPDMYIKQLPRPGFSGRMTDILVVPRILAPGEVKNLAGHRV